MAGLIPQSFIDDLLHRADIVEVIDKRVSLKKSGRNYTACCPFHNEKTPSFSVQPEKQFYYCFGCGAGGNAIGFIMDFDGVDFPQAVETLAGDMGMEVPHETSKEETRKQSENQSLYDLLARASKFYQYQLRQHPGKEAPVSYLKTRGVSGEIARDFALGYAPNGWDNLLNALGQSETEARKLLKAGMVIEKEKGKAEEQKKKEEKGQEEGKEEEKGEKNETEKEIEQENNQQTKAANDQQRTVDRFYDRFRHRIMFPIRDVRGRTIAFGGRVLGDDKPKYLNSPETPVFHKGSELYGLYEAKRASNKNQRMLLVEGYMDVIALAQHGIRNAVATLGTATSTRHLQRLFRLASEIVFCFDGDEAGRTAAWRALETTLPLMEDGRQVRFLFLPDGMDPDDFVRDRGQDRFNKAVNEAAALEDFFFDKLTADIDLSSIEGKARLSNLAKPLIRKLPRGVYAQLMLDRLSDMLGVSSESLDQLLKEQPQPSMQNPPPAPDMPPTPPTEPHRQDKRSGLVGYRKPASLKAIELLLHNPEIALTVNQDLAPLQQAEDEGRKLLLRLIEMIRQDPEVEPVTLIGASYATPLGTQLTQLLKSEKITPTEGMEAEFLQILDNILSDIIKTLESLELKQKLNSLYGEGQGREQTAAKTD